jgi:hypothetical protein
MGQASFYGHLDTPPPPPQPGGPNLPIDSGSSSKTFVQAAGGEVIQATYVGVSSSDRMIAHQASTFYFSGHGYYSPGTLVLNGDETAGLSAPMVSSTDVIWDKNLNTVIIAGCSIFGIRDDKYRAAAMGPHDYNFFTYKWNTLGWTSDPSPGEKWEPLAPKYKLGYCWTAPADSQGTAAIIQKYYSLVKNGENPIQAWGQANKGTAGVNACAIDTSVTPHKYWYFNATLLAGFYPVYQTWISVTKGASGW